MKGLFDPLKGRDPQAGTRCAGGRGGLGCQDAGGCEGTRADGFYRWDRPREQAAGCPGPGSASARPGKLEFISLINLDISRG